MKKVFLIAAIAVFGFTTVNAQEEDKKEFKEEVNEVVEMAKGGGFYVGANIGLPINAVQDFASFNFGFDASYLFDVIPNLEIGPMIAFTQFVGDGIKIDTDGGDTVTRIYKNSSFLPIAASARYYFKDHQFYAGLDTGIAINLAGDMNSGFYVRPKFGYDFGVLTLVGSFASISSNNDYDGGNDISDSLTLSGLTTANIGVEFKF